MAAVLLGILVYLGMAVATCAFVGARRSKLRRVTRSLGENRASRGLTHGYESEFVMAGPDRRSGAVR